MEGIVDGHVYVAGAGQPHPDEGLVRHPGGGQEGVVAGVAGTSVEAHRAGLERRAVLVGLSALVLASDVIGGIVYDATGPGGALIVAALGALTLLGRAGAAISSPPAGSVDLARERGREAPAPSQGAIGGAGNSAQRTR